MENIAQQIKDLKENIVLIYAFNGTGKTQLSVKYKDITKSEYGEHKGVYYNAYSEDLFVWQNDPENNGEEILLNINKSSLNNLHSFMDEDKVMKKLKVYKPKYDFSFNYYSNQEDGVDSVCFYLSKDSEEPIKISRGEERIFVWCFFLALLEIEGFADIQSEHIFIDDPVSSLDDYNIFVTVSTIFSLIEANYENKKIIITTHHIGFYSTLYNYLAKGEESDKYKKHMVAYNLQKNGDNLNLIKPRKSVFLYHLSLLQEIEKAKVAEELRAYHFVLLRQLLENIASFLGVGQFSYVLKKIGIDDEKDVAQIINILSHKNVYYYESDALKHDTKELFIKVFDGVMNKYEFIFHTKK